MITGRVLLNGSDIGSFTIVDKDEYKIIVELDGGKGRRDIHDVFYEAKKSGGIISFDPLSVYMIDE